MKLRIALLFTLAALLVVASLAFAAPASQAASQAVSSAPGPELAAPSFDPAPLFLTSDSCGACSDASCLGLTVGASCGPHLLGRCVSTIQCTSAAKTCRCISPS